MHFEFFQDGFGPPTFNRKADNEEGDNEGSLAIPQESVLCIFHHWKLKQNVNDTSPSLFAGKTEWLMKRLPLEVIYDGPRRDVVDILHHFRDFFGGDAFRSSRFNPSPHFLSISFVARQSSFYIETRLSSSSQ